MLPDLITTRDRLREGATTAPAELERCIDASQAPANTHSFVRTMFEEARTTAVQPGMAQLPLAGLAVSVKDLFDIAGQATPAGSTVLADAPSTAAARARAAGPQSARHCAPSGVGPLG